MLSLVSSYVMSCRICVNLQVEKEAIGNAKKTLRRARGYTHIIAALSDFSVRKPTAFRDSLGVRRVEHYSGSQSSGYTRLLC